MRRLAASTESLAADVALPVPPEPVRALRLRIGRGGASLVSITPVWASTLPIFAVALALRIAVLTVASPHLFHSDFGFGWEAGRVARALASGRGFADPFHGTTGPTAWLAPLYPLVLAGIFKAFGIYSRLSSWMALTFNSLCSAVTAALVSRTGRELFGERTGRRAGWAWALSPYAIYWPLRVVWDTNLTACLLLLVFFLTVRLGHSSSRGLWVSFGLAWGVATLSSPVTLAFAPVSWVWVVLSRRRVSFDQTNAALAMALAVCCVAPWLIRNEVVFGQPVFIRGNFGAELRLGNDREGFGTWIVAQHPTQNPAELARYARLGEVAYVKEKGREALTIIRSDVPLFLANTARRVFWFWCGTTRDGYSALPLLRNFAYASAFLLSLVGLGFLLSRRRSEAVLFAGLFVLFPLVYYVTFVSSRYRHPIEPEMALLIVYALSSVEGGVTALRPRGRPRP